jgi:hypothetical protein
MPIHMLIGSPVQLDEPLTWRSALPYLPRVCVETQVRCLPGVNLAGDIVGFAAPLQRSHSREACPRESGERESTSFHTNCPSKGLSS